MKPTLLVGILSCVALVQSAAYAEGVILTTTIVSVDVRSDAKFIVEFATTIGNSSPSCANAPDANKKMTGFANSDGGKALLQTALAAYLGARTVFVQGAGNCNTPSGYPYESISRLVPK